MKKPLLIVLPLVAALLAYILADLLVVFTIGKGDGYTTAYAQGTAILAFLLAALFSWTRLRR